MSLFIEAMKLPAFEAAVWLSLFAAPLGCILIFRRLSFFGDSLSHASLSGIAFVYLFVGSHPIWLSLGALISALLTTGLLRLFEKWAKLPSDVALTVSYSGMFAVGVLLISSGDLDLEHLLLGDIWSITTERLWFLRIWSFVVMGFLFIFWRALWSMAVDLRFAKGLGFKVDRVDFAFLVITSISVVGVIQSVGVILVAAYLVLPAASALPWVKSLRALTVFAIAFALLSSVLGILLSFRFGFHAGPSIALSGFALLILSHASRGVCRRLYGGPCR
jgi:ABC-type Mn2+/Zn2+ transport system permease subunit